MLLDGELPAIITPQTPQALLDGDARIVRLFADYVARERAYFQASGIFPIMHVTAIRDDVVARHPWVPAALCRAFQRAKELAYRRLANVRVVTLPWFGAHWEDERALFGPDPWRYGLDAVNRKTLETAIRYTHEQGMIGAPPSVDALFVPDCM
jgi:4,5-dihydroxyphthalate decarboxylase